MPRRGWTKNEQLLALRLYLLLPFGQLHKKNKNVISVADAIGRTPSAVAMKACNFASLDPALKQKGLGNASQSDRDLWDSFCDNSVNIALDAENIYREYVPVADDEPDELTIELPEGPTESMRETPVRRVQGFFRRSVLVSYNNRCALTGLSIPKLLIASHIIPWKDNETRRADPTNGIALNALYDKLFDKGFITFGDDLRVIVSKNLIYDDQVSAGLKQALKVEGLSLRLPTRFHPDLSAIQYHREIVFQK